MEYKMCVDEFALRNRSKMHTICWLFYPRVTSSDKFVATKYTVH